jgi:hypothetical protein
MSHYWWGLSMVGVMDIEDGVAASVAYLASGVAMEALAVSTYWPKWDSPWWHMLLLHEMGETRRIPEIAVGAFVEALNAMPVKIFPIREDEVPAGIDPYNDTACHCQLGNVYRVLDAWGLDVDAALPWVGPWFVRYQMADGGMNCDDAAYRVADECPSSMVGTIAAFEAMAMRSRGDLSAPEAGFVDRAAGFMVGRRLTMGSATRHNAAEREAAAGWMLPCFPRFYHYDVLRGLTALSVWAERRGVGLARDVVAPVVAAMDEAFPDGVVRIGRSCWAGHGTIVRSGDGWDHRRQAASGFGLLEAVSGVGAVSPYLTREWAGTRRRALGVMG